MTKQQAGAAALKAMVDELGKLEAELLPFKPKAARVDALRSAIRGQYAAAPAGSEFKLEGDLYVAFVGACGNSSLVDNQALYKLVGPKLFLEMAAVSQKAIEVNCSAAVLGAVVSMKQAGPRALLVVAKT